jgi:hypothetical protein
VRVFFVQPSVGVVHREALDVDGAVADTAGLEGEIDACTKARATGTSLVSNSMAISLFGRCRT